MRVKRLEIQGFKSFKDKTVLHFHDGITGIVGPNGCGKSNIVDAFFWVMGEQSYKHMRGSCSEDLIFNGSSKYSPMGIAEATLVLETDAVEKPQDGAGATVQDIPIHLRAKEVSVTRRVYRTGEGEYLINGVPARLKDIQELFMDTGVGAKGYSVIEQGQIGKIVNAKPEERRLLIEEAAGIAKYKARKKESIRKMEATQGNLSRLNDVVQEIERSLNSLERQAQKARLYRKYKDELLDKEMTWGRRKNQVINQRLDVIKKDKETFEQELVGLRAELQVAENSIEVDRISQLTESKAAEDLQTEIQQVSDELTREKSALNLSRQRRNDLASRIQALEQEKNELTAAIEEETQKIQSKEDETRQANEFFEVGARKAQTMDEQARRLRQETETARRELDSIKREMMNGVSSSSELTSKAASLTARLEAAAAQAERLAQQKSAQDEKVRTAQEELDKAKTVSSEIEVKRQSLAQSQKDLNEQIKSEESATRSAEQAKEALLKELTQTRSRLQSLEELNLAHEGFSDGAKAVLDWAKENGTSERVSALASELEVSQEYETALESWLENRVESLIAQDSHLALNAIEHIRNNNQGHATIYLEGVSTERHKAPSFEEMSLLLKLAGFAVIGRLSDLSQAQSPIALSLLSQVCVVSSIAPATRFIQEGGVTNLKGWSVVSVDGSVLCADGSIRGGTLKADGAASMIRRKRAISELKIAVQEAESRFTDAEKGTQQARQSLEQTKARLQSVQTELQQIEVQSAALSRDVHQMNRAYQEALGQLEYIQLETQGLEEEKEASTQEQKQVELKLEEIARVRAQLEEQVTQKESELALKETETRSIETELQNLRINEASLRERSMSLGRELDATKGLIRDRERRLEEIQRSFERTSSEQQEFSGGESHLESRIEELTLTLANAKEKLSAVKDRMEQSSAQLNTALERIKELHKIIDQKNGDSTQLALELEKLSSELSFLLQNLEEKYGPGCLDRPSASAPIQEEMSEPVVTAEMSVEEERLLGEEVERLRDRIRRLGEVNVMAIEEYEELKKRYDYLLTEKSDLEHSIKNLEEAIEHINKTSEDRFRKAFEAIADRFERLFPIIFGGGQAKLSLVYPEGSTDILEAGVDILAQPPGKKIVNITLLSGGEKALTAVSLIFAIFMVKPSPFCVLDEVDAPLDDANIGKFNALLREMSAKSQFILITHNKKTMELNDTLYGVTMEEPGVSKMVSIQMQ